MKPKLLLVAPAFLVLWTSGCATSALWEEGKFARFHQPATPSNLQLFKGRDQQKILVVYDDENEETNAHRRRAFWADTNRPIRENPYRPSFVPTKATNRLARIAVGSAPLSDDYSAVATNETHGFILFREGREIGFYDLPVYEDDSSRAKQLALTPLAVVADITIVGGALFLLAWSQGGFNDLH